MNILDRFKSKDDFLEFRTHIGSVMAEKMSLPLKPRKLDELVAFIAGAKDFNTALGIIENRPAKKRSRPSEFVITAQIKSDDDRWHTLFDAAEYFESELEAGRLVLSLRELLLGNGCNGDYATDDIARHFYDLDDGVKGVFDYLEYINELDDETDCVGFECTLRAEDVTEWLVNKSFPLLASWFEAYQMDLNLEEYVQTVPLRFSQISDQGHSLGEVGLLYKALGKDFELFFDHQGTNNFKWKYRSDISKVGFTSEKDAIANFLDQFIVHPRVDIAE